tara:strand:- start:784 stop:1284 length:501 start_codon:yes stop_codon:yes gene_type:complete
MPETRYWKRTGQRVTKWFAQEMASKMKAQASYLDDEMEEFTAVDATGMDLSFEIESLFEEPDEFADSGDPVDGSVAVIQDSMKYHKENRKSRMLALRQELEEEFRLGKSEEVSELMSERDLDATEADALWESKILSKVRTEADMKWQEEFDAYVVGLQESYGLAQN